VQLVQIDSRTVEFTCGCGQRVRLVCESNSSGSLISMGCCDTFRVAGDVVRIFASVNGQWIEVHNERAWLQGAMHRIPVQIS
jgi:hypothetical protein